MSCDDPQIIQSDDGLIADVRSMIAQTREGVARTVNAGMTLLYWRIAISKKPEEVAKAELAELRANDKLTPDLVFRDPYIPDYLGLKDRYLEKDLEDAILRELETFLLELGQGFTF